MRIRSLAQSVLAGALLGMLSLTGAQVALAQTQSNACPAGLPPGRPPALPPNQAEPNDGRNRNGVGVQPGGTAYPTKGKCGLALGASSVAAGSSVNAEGDGFRPGSSVTYSLAGGEVAAFSASSSGIAGGAVSVPKTTSAGRYLLMADGVAADGSARQLTAELTVTAAGAATNGVRPAVSAARAPQSSGVLGGLAATGSSGVLPIAAVGAGLAFVGGVAIVGSRRRRSATL